MKTRVRITNLSDDAGNLITNDKEKANLMNQYFSSVFTKEDMSNLPNFEVRVFDQPLSEFNITPEMVKKRLEKLNPSKSPGPDGMHPRVLRELKDQLAEPLSQIYRLSLQNGHLQRNGKLLGSLQSTKRAADLNPAITDQYP